jgi:hypothetical protein
MSRQPVLWASEDEDRTPAAAPERWLAAVQLLALYILGGAGWLAFFSWGESPWNMVDWPKEHGYYQILTQAIRHRQIPYYQSFYAQETNRFLALPESNFAPHVLLLAWLDIPTFFLVHVLLMYSVGFAGCLMIRRYYRLGALPFLLLFLLFSFNGYIVSHLSVGHTMWLGYFLLPWFGYYLLRGLDDGFQRRTLLLLVLVLFGLTLVGAMHILIWCCMFLFLLALFSTACRRGVLFALILSGLLAMFRLLPAMQAFWGSTRPSIFASFATLTDLVHAFVTLRPLNYPDSGGQFGKLGWWESDYYIGLLGTAALVYLGVVLRFSRDPRLRPFHYPQLDGPMVVMALLAVSYFYAPVAMLPVPLANAERVASRFLIIPVMLLLILAAVRLQQVIGDLPRAPLVWILIGAAYLETAFTLGEHMWVWRVTELTTLPTYWQFCALQLEEQSIVPDRPSLDYAVTLAASWAVSAAALVAWVYLFLRAGRPACRAAAV